LTKQTVARLFHQQQRLGAPFKPYFGLSGITQHSTRLFFVIPKQQPVIDVRVGAKEFPDRRSLFTKAAVYLSREFWDVVRCINP
jgi:hypothetical protein